ncbi:MAG: polymer-forming cytoskeletal protein [Rhodocyclaceae bacterium]|nr:polymer-forming cytoskeletal protein [Rhodocyclaceae bacterium]
MFNKSTLFNKRDEVATPTPPSSGTSPINSTLGTASPVVRPTPKPGTFGANMRSQFDTPAAPATNNPSTADSTQKPVAKDSGSRLIVGPDVKLRGAEILDCDTLVVEGRVEATMDSRVIRIAENGAFSGKVGIDVAEIHGNFDGELTAREQLIIHATGKVSGTIRYGKILIEEGGEVSGDVQSLGASHTSASNSSASSSNSDARSDKVKPFIASGN